jgi:tetratricopeptide (TPR) repeat protein
MGERLLFLPSLGFAIILAFLLIRITKSDYLKIHFNTLKQMVSMNKKLFIFVFIIVGLYSIKTFSRNPDWKDELTLFKHDLEYSKNSAKAHYNLGHIMYTMSNSKDLDTTIIKHYIDTAITELNLAQSIYSYGYSDAHKNLIPCYLKKGDYPNVLKYLELIKQLGPEVTSDASYWNDLGLSYCKTNQFEKALAAMDSALKIKPDFAEAFNNKGHAYEGLGKLDEAIIAFKKNVELNPKKAEAYENLCHDYLLLRRNEESIIAGEKTLEMVPNNVSVYCNIGCAYFNLKKYPDAIKNFNKALELDPKDIYSLRYIGLTYQTIGDDKNAKEYFAKEAAIKIILSKLQNHFR